MEVRINVHRPLGGASYVQLPEPVLRKEAVVNLLNVGDENCFMYAILTKCVKNPSQRKLRVSDSTPDVRARANLDFTGLDFPFRIYKIPAFKENNPGVSFDV